MVLLLVAVIVLIGIGFVAPDLFNEILDKLRQIIEAVFPSIVLATA